MVFATFSENFLKANNKCLVDLFLWKMGFAKFLKRMNSEGLQVY